MSLLKIDFSQWVIGLKPFVKTRILNFTSAKVLIQVIISIGGKKVSGNTVNECSKTA